MQFDDKGRDYLTIRSRHSSNNNHVSTIGQVPGNYISDTVRAPAARMRPDRIVQY
jgi:hypothetical protein